MEPPLAGSCNSCERCSWKAGHIRVQLSIPGRSWPHSAPSLYLLLLLGSHAQKLGCSALALWLSGLAPPLAVPSFCLPEGSPATESTRKSQPPGGFALSLRSAFKAQEHSVPNQRPLRSCLISPLFHPKLFPPKKEVEDKRAPGFEGVKSTFPLRSLIRLSFSVTCTCAYITPTASEKGGLIHLPQQSPGLLSTFPHKSDLSREGARFKEPCFGG